MAFTSKRKSILIYLILINLFCFSLSAENLTQNTPKEENLTFEKAVLIFKENNYQLKIAKENLIKAENKLKATKSSSYPQANLSLSARQSGSFSENNGGTHSQSAGLNMSQLLFDASKTKYLIKQAETALEIEKINYNQTFASLYLELKTKFAELLRNQENYLLSTSIVQRRKSNYELVKLRYEAGREHKGSLLNSEAKLKQAEFDLEKSKRSVYLSKKYLLNTLGKHDILVGKVTENLDFSSKYEQKPDINKILQNNSQMKAQQLNLKSSEYSLKSKNAEKWPSISGSGSINKSISYYDGEQNDSDSWSAGINVSYSLLDGGRKTAELKQLEAEKRKIALEQQSLKDDVFFNLENAWADLQNALFNIKIQKNYLTASIERSNIGEAQYSNGLIDFEAWALIEDDLVSSKKSYLNAQIEALKAEANWLYIKNL